MMFYYEGDEMRSDIVTQGCLEPLWTHSAPGSSWFRRMKPRKCDDDLVINPADKLYAGPVYVPS